MDSLLLLAGVENSIGYDGRGDFIADRYWRLDRPPAGAMAPYVNIGVYLIHPRLFEHTLGSAFSMNLLWDHALGEGRLFGLKHDGLWLHAGTPEALAAANVALSAAKRTRRRNGAES